MITSDHICAKKHIVEVSLICPNYLGEIRSHQESKNLTKSPAVSPRVHSSHQVRRHVGEIQSHQESHQHGCARGEITKNKFPKNPCTNPKIWPMKHTSNEFTNEFTNERCNEHTNDHKNEHTTERGVSPSKMKTVYFLFQNRPDSRGQIFIMAHMRLIYWSEKSFIQFVTHDLFKCDK